MTPVVKPEKLRMFQFGPWTQTVGVHFVDDHFQVVACVMEPARRAAQGEWTDQDEKRFIQQAKQLARFFLRAKHMIVNPDNKDRYTIRLD